MVEVEVVMKSPKKVMASPVKEVGSSQEVPIEVE